ncbi:MAG: Asp23/Gls24 family envelope stress response protein [Candidatus Omnitrophica bacterium]|nr:Asp23/Gls24 family envelope stress response protein [Candidatus Omnitrophota bacterium]
MTSQESRRSDFGLIKIHRNVIAEIASMAAGEVEGVSRVGSGLIAKAVNLLTRGRIRRYPVKIELKENNEVEICISIIVKYGVNIPEVASKTQENIKKAVEKMVGLYASDIHVKVKGVEIK